MDNKERLWCNQCGSLALIERAGELFCTDCGNSILQDVYRRERYEGKFSFSEKRKLLRKVAVRLSADEHTPQEILACRFSRFRKIVENGKVIYRVEFFYEGKNYFLSFDEKGIAELSLPKDAEEWKNKRKTDKKFLMGYMFTILSVGVITAFTQKVFLLGVGIAFIFFLIYRNIKRHNKFILLRKKEKYKNLTAFLAENDLSPIAEEEKALYRWKF